MNLKKISQLLILLASTPIVILSQEITLGGKLLDKENGQAVSNVLVVLEPGNSMVVNCG